MNVEVNSDNLLFYWVLIVCDVLCSSDWMDHYLFRTIEMLKHPFKVSRRSKCKLQMHVFSTFKVENLPQDCFDYDYISMSLITEIPIKSPSSWTNNESHLKLFLPNFKLFHVLLCAFNWICLLKLLILGHLPSLI